ncbi:hypothetical protein ACWGCW_19015 [Streptomyces sp. NPDC054933]
MTELPDLRVRLVVEADRLVPVGGLVGLVQQRVDLRGADRAEVLEGVIALRLPEGGIRQGQEDLVDIAEAREVEVPQAPAPGR